ncbi:hypothetical protein GWI33_016586 [Rhynchophorus ferrugineus]|uniref:Uncharacterized protein n=1 Tax=Rhynchophorus ferrugineus TaxID=354439 RepID=A0A834M6Y9_RHYFE|nr:hypothetical protein GWI33_016586 [Rhynchophorus ferrugineus]
MSRACFNWSALSQDNALTPVRDRPGIAGKSRRERNYPGRRRVSRHDGGNDATGKNRTKVARVARSNSSENIFRRLTACLDRGRV